MRHCVSNGLNNLRHIRGVYRSDKELDKGQAQFLTHGVRTIFVCLLMLSALTLTAFVVPRLTDPAVLATRSGKLVRDFVFAPIQGGRGALPKNGKPTIVIVFASWCPACLLEMPSIVADQHQFRDSVNFIGIDYYESAKTARSFIELHHIKFPTESFDPDSYTKNDGDTRPLVVHVPGGKLSPDALEAFKGALPTQTYKALLQIAKAQRSENAAGVHSLEQHLGLNVENIGSLSSDVDESFSLPHAFVIDGSGILREDLVGYDAGTDRIRQAIKRLGIVS